MENGAILGYDLNDIFAQISVYSEENEEPQTAFFGSERSRIPLAIAKKDGSWLIGSEAQRLKTTGEAPVAEGFYEAALLKKTIAFGSEDVEAIWLLAKFVAVSLGEFTDIAEIVFTVPALSMDTVKLLKSIAVMAGISKSHVGVQDHRESFCDYVLFLPRELWQYETALFEWDGDCIKASMLRRLRKGAFVTVDEVASAKIEELSLVYPVLNVDRAGDADIAFKQFISGIFAKRIVSSVFLVGEGFDGGWYTQSLKLLCNGRRVFAGNNLFSRGACCAALKKARKITGAPVYLDETKLLDQICLKLRTDGKESWQPVVSYGTRWYEADTEFEILLENDDDIEIHAESLVDGDMTAVRVPLKGYVSRRPYSIRLKVSVMFTDEKTAKITFRDMGFGDFYAPNGFTAERVIRAGGINGQYNSLSS